MSSARPNPLKQAIIWWMLENQDLYRQDAIGRMNQWTDEQRRTRPIAGLHSPVWLLVHLAETERHYLDMLRGIAESRRFLTLPSEQPEPEQWPPWDELLKFVSQTRNELEEQLQGMDEAGMAHRYGDKPYLTGAWIIAHLFEHESFHMGQLRWALRALN